MRHDINPCGKRRPEANSGEPPDGRDHCVGDADGDGKPVKTAGRCLPGVLEQNGTQREVLALPGLRILQMRISCICSITKT